MKPPTRPDRPIRRGYADRAGGQVHYRIAEGASDPDAAPLLMLHPTPKSGWIYEGMVRRLAATGRTVVAPDTPGYGASDPLPGQPDIADYADAMVALLRLLRQDGAIGGGPVDILGYHTGSVIGCDMALCHPTAVRRLVLFSLPLYDAAERQAKLLAVGQWPGPEPDGSHLQQMWNIVGNLCDPRVDTFWQQRSVVENLRAIDGSAGYGAVYRYDLFAALPMLSQPVLLMNAEDDLFELTRLARRLLSSPRYRELPGLAHGMFDLETEMLAAEIDAFLAAT